MELPSRVRVVEVGPRDGLQNEPEVVSTPDKLDFIRQLMAAGLPAIEVGSFVRPDLVPQMADTEQLVEQLLPDAERHGTELIALVPNHKGLERARAAGIEQIAVFTAASEAFNQANVRMSIDESLDELSGVIGEAKQSGLRVRGYLSTCWWCPFSGRVDPQQVLRVVLRLADLGCDELCVADTVGAATPVEVNDLLLLLLEHLAVERLAVHFHDTRGTALANVVVAGKRGITTFDASAGGLGGCPFAPNAQGNLATEDLLFMLHGMNIETGTDVDAVRAASKTMQQRLGRRLPSRYLLAGPFRVRERRSAG